MNIKSMILTLTVIPFLFNACGASKRASGEYSTDNSSRATPNDDHSPTLTDGVLSECSGFNSSGLGISGASTSFFNPQTNQFVPNLIRLAFKSSPLSLASSSSYYLQFFRWGYDSKGVRISNSTATPIWFQSKSTGKYLNSSPETRISRTVIQNLITQNSLSSQGVTPSNFLDHVILVLDDVGIEYDAFTIAQYDSSKGTAAQAWLDFLIPAFSANPNTYASTHPVSILQQLHPNYDVKDSSLSDEQFRQRAEAACQGFL